MLAIPTHSLLLCLAGAGAAACSTPYRHYAAEAYYKGTPEDAGQFLTKAIAAEATIKSSLTGTDQLPAADWQLGGKDGPLIAFEQVMVYLRQGDTQSARDLLIKCRETFPDRRPEFLRLEGLANLEDLLLAGGATSYQIPAFEELSARSLLMLAELVGDRLDTLPFANQFDSTQNELLTSSYGVESDPTSPESRSHLRTLGIGHYIEAIIKEELAGVDAAEEPFREAHALLPDSEIVSAQHERVQGKTFRRQPEEGLVHVFYLLGRGPKLASSKYDLKESDALFETVIRTVTVGIEALKQTMSSKDYKFSSVVVASLTQAPVPVPFLEDVDRQIRPLDPLRASISGAENPVEVQATSETMVDFHAMAQRSLDDLKAMLLSRAILRRAVKEAGLQSIEMSLLRGVARFFATSVEDTDTRNWQTLPAEIRVARVALPQGQNEIDLGIAGVAPVTVVTSNEHDTYVLVIDPGEAQPNPMILVDRLSQPR